MNDAAPAFLVALESSGVGNAIRQSIWIYPTANIAHILALTVFAGAVAIMDVRMLGGFKGTAPAAVILPARQWAISALLAMVVSGAVLFIAEASHVAMNPVFQVKAGLIAVGILNALFVARTSPTTLASFRPDTPLPARLRVAAIASLSIWLLVAASGRFIAYL